MFGCCSGWLSAQMMGGLVGWIGLVSVLLCLFCVALRCFALLCLANVNASVVANLSKLF